LILLKTKDRFTSLTLVGVMKIMCNGEKPQGNGRNPRERVTLSPRMSKGERRIEA
jgi:hypothetical protein